MTCPECGAKAKTVNGVVKYHTRPDDLSACPASRTKAKAEEPKPSKKTATKKAKTED